MPDTNLPTRIQPLCPADWAQGAKWQAMQSALKTRGCTVVVGAAGGVRRSLVQDARDANVDVGLLIATSDADLKTRLDALPSLPLPVVCIAPHASPARRRQGFNAGVQVWLDALPPSAEALQHQFAGAH